MAEAGSINIEKLKEWECFGMFDQNDESCKICPGARICQEEVESKVKLREDDLNKVKGPKEAENKIKRLPTPDADLLPIADDEEEVDGDNIKEVVEIEFEIIEKHFPYLGEIKFLAILKNLNQNLTLRTMPNLVKIFKGKQIEENRICSINVYANDKNEIKKYIICFKHKTETQLAILGHDMFYENDKTVIEINKDTPTSMVGKLFKGVG